MEVLKVKMCFLTVLLSSWWGQIESCMKGVLKPWRGNVCFGGCVWCSACRLYCAGARSSFWQLPPLWLWGLKGGAPRFLCHHRVQPPGKMAICKYGFCLQSSRNLNLHCLATAVLEFLLKSEKISDSVIERLTAYFALLTLYCRFQTFWFLITFVLFVQMFVFCYLN